MILITSNVIFLTTGHESINGTTIFIYIFLAWGKKRNLKRTLTAYLFDQVSGSELYVMHPVGRSEVDFDAQASKIVFYI